MAPVRLPSPAALGLAAFAAGIALGVHPAAQPALAGILVAVGTLVWAARRGHRSAAVLAAVTVVGIGHGFAARRIDSARCAAVLGGTVRLVVELAEPAPAGRPARAEPIGAGCRGSIAIRHRTPDTLWAGSRVEIEGEWRPRSSPWGPADGILAARQVAPRPGTVGPLDRLRNRLLRAAAELYGARSGIVEALLLGSRGTIDRELGDSFSRTGLVHLLSISGFHVGLVWGWALLGFRLAGVRRLAPAAAAVLVIGYVLFIGASPPAIRAALLAVVTAIERARQRQPSTGALFALVAIAVLIADPWAIGDLGGWLSIVALWGATAAVRWSDRALGDAAWFRMGSSSIGATVATAPLTALAFGTVPVAGVVLNFVAIPITALAVPAAAASLLVAPLSIRLAEAFATGGGALLGLLETIATQGARIPGAAMTFEAGPIPAAVAGLVVGLTIWAFGFRQTRAEAARRIAWCGAIACLGHGVMVAWPRFSDGSSLTLHFLDVGQGDATLLETPRGHWLLIDAGPADDRWDAGSRVIVPYLRRHGVRRLEAVILSHGHRDHFGGIGAVLEAVSVGRLLEPGRRIPDRAYLALIDAVDDDGIDWIPTRKGARLDVDGVGITALHPDTGWARWGDDLNEDSVVLRITAGDFDAIFTGDAGIPVEETLAGERVADLLKVGHHGSRGATGAGWLSMLAPKVAIISVGAGNRYGHPAPEALARLAKAGVPVWRTDLEGTVTVSIGVDSLEVRGRRGRERYSIR